MNAKAKDDYVILAGEDVVGFLPSCTSQRLTDWLFEHYADDPAKYSLIHDARKMRDAIAANPGAVREALTELLNRGDEPTRSALKRAITPAARSLGIGRENLRAAVGTDTATDAERGNNLYETGPEAMRTLLALESFTPDVLEPACGKGAILRPLEAAGYELAIGDLVDYGTATKDGELQAVGDFLASTRRWKRASEKAARPDIVTNPPYGAALNAFVAHALKQHRPRKMALLLNLNFLCGFEDPDRNLVMDFERPARVWVFSRRLPMMHRAGWDGNEAASRMNTAWFVWQQRATAQGDFLGYDGPTEIKRVDWKDFETAEALAPGRVRP